ncbi:MAG: alkaline phosphatase family protein [Lentisphaeraceae bacterium]|nr:alkaline phosphatase family protein [Lentisphaeraceae bacterium]
MKKKEKIVLNMFVDAFGWELLQENPFLTETAPHQHRLESVFGYSSACIPSILMGCKPQEHGYWTSFYYSPKTSPFKFLSPLGLVPKFIINRSRIRHYVDKLAKKVMKWKGYLSFYNFPFKYIGLFDYYEKENFYEPGSTTKPTIFDHLVENNIPYFSFDQDMDEELQFDMLADHLRAQDIDFAYLSMTKVDGKAHMNERSQSPVKDQIKYFEGRIQGAYDIASEYYEDVVLNVFSDHDMAPITNSVDIMKVIEETGLKFSEDFVAVYDSTMARFWPFNDRAEKIIGEVLAKVPEGKMLTDSELKSMGTYYADDSFGKMFFILEEGTLIIPSFMGEKPIPGMHGYLPDSKHSYSMCVTNQKYDKKLNCITDIYQLMKDCI